MAVSALNALTSADVLNKILFEHYGIRGKIRKLSGERDQNFHLISDGDQEYVVKVSTLSALKEIEFQNEVLIWLYRSNLPTPEVLFANGDRSCVKIQMPDGQTGVLRMLSWLNGIPLGDVPYTDQIVKDVAKTQSMINCSLARFEKNYVNHDLVWDMEQLASLKSLVSKNSLGERFDLISETIEKFIAYVQPKLSLMRRQIIHNDFNPHNVLVDPKEQKVTGVLDFGDVIEGPLIVDVAVALAYMVSLNSKDPLCNVRKYLFEYNKYFKLYEDELEIVLDLVKTRLAMILVISSWRASEYPDRKEYVMRNNQLSWLRLKAVVNTDVGDFNKSIKDLCLVG